jgi:hypothetical protein
MARSDHCDRSAGAAGLDARCLRAGRANRLAYPSPWTDALRNLGRVQAKGGPVREIRPGDVVWIPPNEKHWHGASPTNGMTHVAMQEALDGSYVTWMEHVTDAEYSAGVG